MNRSMWVAVALAAAAVGAQAQTKKELAARVIAAQKPVLDTMAREIAERPAVQLRNAAQQALQQLPADKREAAGKQAQADLKQFVDEAVPIMRERMAKVAPTVYGAMLEEKFSVEELKQIATFLESPANKKLQENGGPMQQQLLQKLVADAAPAIDPKLKALQEKLRATLGVAPPGAPASAASK